MRIILALAFLSSIIYAQNGPMNADWFYATHSDFRYQQANEQMQCGNWKSAENLYLDNVIQANNYDEHMAQLNAASCRMAKGEGSPFWAAMDHIIEIDLQKRYCLQNPPRKDYPVTILTCDISMADIADFLPAVLNFKKRNDLTNISLAVRACLFSLLHTMAQENNIVLVDEDHSDEAITKSKVITHLVGLMGHRAVSPDELKLKKPLFTAQETALNKVRTQLEPLLARKKKLAFVFLGEREQVTLLGGKQLPCNILEHGRELDAAAFEPLLDAHNEIVLIDCNPKNYRIICDDVAQDSNKKMASRFKDRVIALIEQDEEFDTTVALGGIMSGKKMPCVSIASDCGAAHVFIRSLSQAAQKKCAFIISNPQEYDVRMNGKGNVYEHLLSYCRVYKCKSPEDQAEVIQKAYADVSR